MNPNTLLARAAALPRPQMRSGRNFCIDIILLCIILGIVTYLVTTLKKKP
jgi:hypothetical protein